MNASELGGLVRAIVAFAGGYIVKEGIVDADTFNQVSGAVATLIVAAWSIRAKRAAA